MSLRIVTVYEVRMNSNEKIRKCRNQVDKVKERHYSVPEKKHYNAFDILRTGQLLKNFQME